MADRACKTCEDDGIIHDIYLDRWILCPLCGGFSFQKDEYPTREQVMKENA